MALENWIRGACCCLLTGLFFSGSIHAAEFHWQNTPPPGVVVNEELQTVLQKITAHQGANAVISPDLQGRVMMDFSDMTTDQIMIELSRSFGFDWFYDGRVVYFFPIDEIGHQVVPLDENSIDDLTQVLEDLQLIDDRYPIVRSTDKNIVLVNGPPQYVALVEQTIEAMKTENNIEEDDAIEHHHDDRSTHKDSRLPRVHYGYAAN